MNINKIFSTKLPYCYAVSKINSNLIVFASDENGPCFGLDNDFNIQTIWNKQGGTMSMVPLPNKKEEFLAIQQFNPVFKAENAIICHIYKDGNNWKQRTIVKFPFVHRFDILKSNGKNYLICCTICSEKKSVSDWSSSGNVYVSELNNDLSQKIELKPLFNTPLTRNHGFCRIKDNEVLISADQGVYSVSCPIPNSDWKIYKILDAPVSDIALVDIDNDGIEELATIEAFHGNSINIYKKTNSSYSKIFSIKDTIDFTHVIWGGKILGKNCFIGGCRAKEQDLFLIDFKNGAFEITTIDKGKGPSNIMVKDNKKEALLYVANREFGEAAIYKITN